MHERYRRQTTDGWAIAYSEREREFTFAKKRDVDIQVNANLAVCLRAILTVIETAVHSIVVVHTLETAVLPNVWFLSDIPFLSYKGQRGTDRHTNATHYVMTVLVESRHNLHAVAATSAKRLH